MAFLKEGHTMSILKKIKETNCLAFPRILQIEITDKCPLRCPQCYRLELSEHHIDYEYLIQVIREGIDGGPRLFVLNGGEPLLYYKIEELLRFFEGKPIYVNCFSSGIGLNETVVHLLKRNPSIRLCLSLNGSTEEINSKSRDGYKATINAMKLLAENNVNYGVHWVSRHDNVEDLYSLIEMLEENNCGFLSVGSNKLTHNRVVESKMNYSEFIKLKEFLMSYSGKLQIMIENCFPEMNKEIFGINNLFDGCGAGRTMCHITTDGHFAPCTHLHYYEKFNSILEYWNNSNILFHLRKRDLRNFDQCMKCKMAIKCKMCLASSIDSYCDFDKGNVECYVRG